MMIQTRLRDPALRNFGVYGFATALSAVMTLVLTRVLWRSLTPSDFGVWALIDPMLLPAGSLLLLGTDHAIVKQLRMDKVTLRQVSGTLLVTTLPISALGLLVIGLIADRVFHIAWTTELLLAIASEALVLMLQTALRATGAVYGFAFLLLSRSVLYLVVLLIAQAYLGLERLSLGLTFLARGACAGIAGLAALAVLRPVLRANWARYCDAVRYGFPLLLATFIYSIYDMTDRWFLADFSGVVAVGVYAVHLKLAAILSQAIVLPFGLWFQPERFKRLAVADEGRGFFIRVAVALAVTCGFLAGGVWLARDPLLSLIAPNVSVSPLVLACFLGAIICLALAQALNVGLMLPGHTGKNAVCVGYAAAATALAACLLVPFFAMNGAAISRLIGGLVLLVTTTVWSARIFAVAFPFYTLALYFAGSIVALVLIDELSGPNLVGTAAGLAVWAVVSAMSFGLLWRRFATPATANLRPL
jgi:O-antigen/teichoic acid export membrane protein